MMIEAVIFDCFGVIITDALQGLIDDLRSKQPHLLDEVVDLVSAANHGMLDRNTYQTQLATLFGLSLAQYQSRLADGEVKNQRVLDYAKELRRTYKTALLSNVSPGGLAQRFKPGELEACFDCIVTSGETGYAKPEQQAYEIVADRLGVRLDACVMIDDREEYCLGAQGVGMRAIRYKSFTSMRHELAELLSVIPK